MDRKQREALNQAKRLAVNVAGIEGVDFGLLYRAGRSQPRKLGIRFHVRRKLPLNELSGHNLLPSQIAGIPCDVIQASYQPHALRPTDMVNPLQPGISIGNLPRQATGSLGAFVRDAQTGAICVLSNWHVLCASVEAATGESICQPGPQHLGVNVPREIAKLLRSADLSHGLDAAVAGVGADIAIERVPFGLQSAPAGVAEPAIGMRAIKSGVVTGVTRGKVDGIGGSFPLDYTAFGDTRRWMDGVRLVIDPEGQSEEISLKGDSGALWIDVATNQAVGLHFAGEDGLGPLAEYALAHPLPAVLNALQVEWMSSPP
jgi:hypothetical protein